MNQQTASAIDRGTTSRTHVEIRNWMVSYIGHLLGLEQGKVDTTLFFNKIGLDSMMVIVMTEELGQWLGHDVAPTIAYDYPTIDRFSAYLSEAHRSQP